jgi:DNA-binding NarL/FixJ family response regulator
VRDGLRYSIERQFDLEVCGEAERIDEGFALFKELNPDLTIVDILLRDGSGMDLVRKIKGHRNTAKVLVFSSYDESSYAHRSLRAGADGYLNKLAPREQVLEAVRTVLGGKRYLSRKLTEQLVRQAVTGATAVNSDPTDLLSNREMDVFRLIGQGKTTGAIARKLILSPHTVDTHRERIKGKLGLKNSGELIREAVKWSLENE